MDKKIVFPIAAAAFTLCLAHMVFAHAFPRSQTPPAGATVSTPPAQVSITFDAPLEAMFYRLQVLSANDVDETDGHASIGSDSRSLSAPIKPLAPGDYTVRWAVVAEDGHRTEGSYTFTVSAPGSR